MKIVYKNYTRYIDNDDPNTYNASEHPELYDKYKFDQEKYMAYLSNRQYDDAVQYAQEFTQNDVKKQERYEENLEYLRSEGRKVAALYGRLDKTRELPKVEFLDKVFINKGLDNISDNDYARQFNDIKNRIGGIFNPYAKAYQQGKPLSADDDGMTQHADRLQLTFQPKKQSWLGIDALAADNDFNIDAFYEFSGLDENQLKNNGIIIDHKDGVTTLQIDKSNPLANELLYSFGRFRGEAAPEFHGISMSQPNAPKLEGITREGTVIAEANDNDIKALVSLIDDAKDTKQQALEANSYLEKDYTGFQAGFVSDDLAELQEFYYSNPDAMTESEYNKEFAKRGGDDILRAIRSISGKEEFYTNMFNDDPSGDRTMIKVNEKDVGELIDRLSGTAKNELTFTYGCVDGRVGLVVSIGAELEETKSKEKHSRYQVFIPNFLTENAQKAIMKDTRTRSAYELNNMQDWGYSYKCEDGTELAYTGTDTHGNATYVDLNSKEVYSKDEAHRLLNKDMAVRDAKRKVKYRHMNINGQLIDRDGYETDARQLALLTAEELYPGIIFEDFNGQVYDPTTQAGIDAIFGHKLDKENLQYNVYDKLQDVYDIYDKIMSAISIY